jgi:cell division protein FtsQ
MVAATLRDRRGDAKSRAKRPRDRARPRVSRPAGAAHSKLKAAQGVRLGASAALAIAALVAALILAATLATDGRGAGLVAFAEKTAQRVEDIAWASQGLTAQDFAALGFRVAEVHLQGASPASQKEIFRVAAVPQGAPILSLNLAAIRARVEQVVWVEHARVIRLLPDTIVIAVEERPLMAVWQHQGRLDAVVADGRVDPAVDPRRLSSLPRIIGPGANTEAARLLPLLSKRPALVARLRGIRRVDQRRWDLLLKDGGTILLPASGEAEAFDALDRLDRTSRILGLGLARIDLRNPRFVVVRPANAANMATGATGGAVAPAPRTETAPPTAAPPVGTEARD